MNRRPPVLTGGQIPGCRDLAVRRRELGRVALLRVDAGGELRTDNSPGGRADDQIGIGQVDPTLAEPGQHPELPRDAGDPATTENEGPLRHPGTLTGRRVRHPDTASALATDVDGAPSSSCASGSRTRRSDVAT
jgi:hypothetical protein